MEKVLKYEYTKTPLDYQITEYDCGTTTLLNALRYLFKREEISPVIYKFIMSHTLDQVNESGEIGKGGTSVYALDFLTNWLNECSSLKGMNMKCESLPIEEVSIYNKKLEEKINSGAVAIVRVNLDVDHYCLLTKMDDEYAYFFDPYYLDITYYDNDEDIEIIKDRPFEYNRKVRKERVEENSKRDLALVRGKNCKAVIIEKI